MRAAEILRNLANVIDQAQNGKQAAEVPQQSQRAELTPVEVDNTEGGDGVTMVAPLQQKMELLKKAAGVPNMYDEHGSGDVEEEDPLNQMKKMAGIQVITTAGEDNDIEG